MGFPVAPLVALDMTHSPGQDDSHVKLKELAGRRVFSIIVSLLIVALALAGGSACFSSSAGALPKKVMPQRSYYARCRSTDRA